MSTTHVIASNTWHVRIDIGEHEGPPRAVACLEQ